jgi:geranylgeranyl pyrophosphate synthase
MTPAANAEPAAARIDEWMKESRAWAERALERALPRESEPPALIHEAMRYAIFGGGKRLRPALVRLMCAHFGGRDEDAAPAAVAIECVHTYSLVHDDLPCMDDDDLRRGRPTCHRVYGEAMAVLAGDALLTFAFQVLARSPAHGGDLCAILSAGAGPSGMVGGQVLDLEPMDEVDGEPKHAKPTHSEPARDKQAHGKHEHSAHAHDEHAHGEHADGEHVRAPGRVTRERVEHIHRLKTAALIASATEMGACAAGADRRARELARNYGLALGRCFQAVDDVLDVTGDAATLGKTPGKDAHLGKPTLVAALGLEGAREEARRLAREAERTAIELSAQPGSLVHDLIGALLDRRA